MGYVLGIIATFALALLLQEQKPCAFTEPRGTFSIRHVNGHPNLSVDPDLDIWKDTAEQSMSKDCRRQIDYPNLETKVHGFWTDSDLYLLFRCPYTELNLFLPADNTSERVGVWNRDVVEMFIGDDWDNIRHYREFEIAPTGDWIDLAIDLDRHSYDHTWQSGWQTMAHINEQQKVWYAAARIPLSAVSSKAVEPGTKWRLNLYRIDGVGPDQQRHFMCWQRTCGGNHVPDSFGTLVFEK